MLLLVTAVRSSPTWSLGGQVRVDVEMVDRVHFEQAVRADMHLRAVILVVDRGYLLVGYLKTSVGSQVTYCRGIIILYDRRANILFISRLFNAVCAVVRSSAIVQS